MIGCLGTRNEQSEYERSWAGGENAPKLIDGDNCITWSCS